MSLVEKIQSTWKNVLNFITFIFSVVQIQCPYIVPRQPQIHLAQLGEFPDSHKFIWCKSPSADEARSATQKPRVVTSALQIEWTR